MLGLCCVPCYLEYCPVSVVQACLCSFLTVDNHVVCVCVYPIGIAIQAEYFGKKVIVNLSKEGLKKMLHRRAINHQQRLRIPPGSNIAFRVKGPNPSDVNSGVNVMYQVRLQRVLIDDRYDAHLMAYCAWATVTATMYVICVVLCM